MDDQGSRARAERPEQSIDVVVEEPRWDEIDVERIAGQAAAAALRAVGRDPSRCEVSLLACSDERIAALNAEFRDRNAVTDVLSWPARPEAAPVPGSPTTFLGDIALAFGECARASDERGISLEDHTAHLVIHGVLHLTGLDHETQADAEAMEAIERKALAELGIADPYSSEERPSGVALRQEK